MFKDTLIKNPNLDMEIAKRILADCGCTCAFVKGTSIQSNNGHGINYLLGLVENGIVLEGYSVADKVVGRAAPPLYHRGIFGIKKAEPCGSAFLLVYHGISRLSTQRREGVGQITQGRTYYRK